MIWHFEHRWATYEEGNTRDCTRDDKRYQNFVVQPRYWVSQADVEARLPDDWNHHWLLGFRRVTDSRNQRSAVFSLLPLVGVAGTAPIIFLRNASENSLVACFLANVDSLAFDYVVRQKVGGTDLTYTILNQLPVLPPHTYTPDNVVFIVPRVMELVYTAWDMMPFANDLWREADEDLRTLLKKQWEENRSARGGHSNPEPPEWVELTANGISFPPFKWDEDRRAILRAELDAHFARLYDLTEEELRYILDPSDVFGEDYPGETFRVLKEKEIRKYGEYRTKRLVLEAWSNIPI